MPLATLAFRYLGRRSIGPSEMIGKQDEASTKDMFFEARSIAKKWKANTRFERKSRIPRLRTSSEENILEYALHIECRKMLASMPGNSLRYKRHDVHSTN